MDNTKIFAIVILLNFITIAVTILRFTNIKCDEFDPSFATFQKCQLKVVQRGVVALSLHCKVLKVPVDNVTVNLSVYKKSDLTSMYSPYNSFLYNVTADFCHFMKNRKKYPFLNIVNDNLRNYSNINHTCPYSHDINVHEMILKEDMFKYIPVPFGEYMFRIKVGCFNQWKVDVKAYATVELRGLKI